MKHRWHCQTQATTGTRGTFERSNSSLGSFSLARKRTAGGWHRQAGRLEPEPGCSGISARALLACGRSRLRCIRWQRHLPRGRAGTESVRPPLRRPRGRVGVDDRLQRGKTPRLPPRHDACRVPHHPRRKFYFRDVCLTGELTHPTWSIFLP